MNQVKLIAFLLLFSSLLGIEHTALEIVKSEAYELQKPKSPDYTLLFEQQCPIKENETRDIHWDSSFPFSYIWPLLHYIYLFYSITSTIIIDRECQNGYFCFTYTLVSLVKQIHVGFHFMLYCKLIEGNQIKGNIFFAIILFVNLWKMISVVFSGRLIRKQKIHAVAYFAFRMITGVWFKGLCELGIHFIFFVTHYYQLDFYKRTQDGRLSSIYFINFGFNMLIYALVQVFYPQLLMSKLSPLQDSLFHYAIIVGTYVNYFKAEHLVRSIWRYLVCFFYVVILKRLGYKLERETCKICWQEMELFAGVNQMEDLDDVYSNGLIRVHLNHIFHAKCLSKWISVWKTCPLDGIEIKS